MLCINSRNKVANENMDVFKTTWETQVRLLTEAIDDITNFSDFLSVSESHILDDVNKCVFAVQDKDMEQLDKTAAVVRGVNSEKEISALFDFVALIVCFW